MAAEHHEPCRATLPALLHVAAPGSKTRCVVLRLIVSQTCGAAAISRASPDAGQAQGVVEVQVAVPQEPLRPVLVVRRASSSASVVGRTSCVQYGLRTGSGRGRGVTLLKMRPPDLLMISSEWMAGMSVPKARSSDFVLPAGSDAARAHMLAFKSSVRDVANIEPSCNGALEY